MLLLAYSQCGGKLGLSFITAPDNGFRIFRTRFKKEVLYVVRTKTLMLKLKYALLHECRRWGFHQLPIKVQKGS